MGMLEDDTELDDDVQKEVDKVLDEIMTGKLTKAPAAPEASIRLPEPGNEELNAEEDEAEVEEDLEEMQSRLQALRS